MNQGKIGMLKKYQEKNLKNSLDFFYSCSHIIMLFVIILIRPGEEQGRAGKVDHKRGVNLCFWTLIKWHVNGIFHSEGSSLK